MTILTGARWGGSLIERWLTRLGPVALPGLINATCLALFLATLTGWGDPDLVLDGLWVSLAIGAFVFGLRPTVLRVLILTSIALAYSAIHVVALGQTPEIDLMDLVEWPLMIALTLLIAVMADRVSTTARRYAALYRQATNRLVKAQEDERGSLARDLHDGVGQTLTAVVLTLDAAEAALSTGQPAGPAQTAIQRARGLAAAALDDTRAVAARLHPGRIGDIGLGAAVGELAESAGITVDVRFEPSLLPPGLLEPEREIDLYRIIQEALSNAARHSHAGHVWIDAEIRGDGLWVQIGDNGIGFDRATTPLGLGLVGMAERADILRGRLRVRSKPGDGTTVDLSIPLLVPARVSAGTALAIPEVQAPVRWPG